MTEEIGKTQASTPVMTELLKISSQVLTWLLIEALKKIWKIWSAEKTKRSPAKKPASTAQINRDIFFEKLSDGIVDASLALYFSRSLFRYAASPGLPSKVDVVVTGTTCVLVGYSMQRAGRAFGAAIVARIRMRERIDKKKVSGRGGVRGRRGGSSG